MSEENLIPEVEWTVICSDCLSEQNIQKVMKSMWYKQGMTPPCHFCGGVTHEIARSEITQFIDDTNNGKRRM